MINTLRSWGSNIVRRLAALLPDFDRSRFRTGPAWITIVALILVCGAFLIVRIYRLSTAIRKLKESSWGHPDRAEMKKLKRRSRLGTLLCLILFAALGFILIYFVYPRIPGLVPSGEMTYEDLVEQVRRTKLLNVILGLALLLLSRRCTGHSAGVPEARA